VPDREPTSARSWEAVVSVREAVELTRELVARLARETGRRSIGVTDLISLRPAFYRTVAPEVPIPPARQARLERGRLFHRALGARLAREGTLEARIRRDGIVGRIDILGELPIEVKTATSLAVPDHLSSDRPDHVEQLGMYCALVDRPVGRLLTLVADAGAVSDVQAVDVSFGSTERIRAEMRRRAELLRTAWSDRRAESLPRCPWYGRGCEFEEARVCDCTGEEPPGSSAILEETGRVDPRDDVRERVRSAFTKPLPGGDEFAFARFREILYPRRAYFDRTAPAPSGPTRAPPPAATPATPQDSPASREPDLYARLNEALESGPAGEVARLPPRSSDPEEEVTGFRGRPLLVRTSRAWARFREDALLARSPQYPLELGLRCAVTGTDSGIVVLGFERAKVDADRVQVLEVRFRSLTPFSRRIRERRRELAEALRTRNPKALSVCPEWMIADCPYRSECGCAEAGVSVTR